MNSGAWIAMVIALTVGMCRLRYYGRLMHETEVIWLILIGIIGLGLWRASALGLAEL